MKLLRRNFGLFEDEFADFLVKEHQIHPQRGHQLPNVTGHYQKQTDQVQQPNEMDRSRKRKTNERIRDEIDYNGLKTSSRYKKKRRHHKKKHADEENRESDAQVDEKYQKNVVVGDEALDNNQLITTPALAGKQDVRLLKQHTVQETTAEKIEKKNIRHGRKKDGGIFKLKRKIKKGKQKHEKAPANQS